MTDSTTNPTTGRTSSRATGPRRAGAVLALAAAGLVAAAGCSYAAPAVEPITVDSVAGSVPAAGATTPGATTPGAATPVALAPAEPLGAPVGIDGEYTVAAGDAATVRFGVAGQQVSVLEIVLEPGWTQVRDQRGVDEVALAFSRDQTVVGVEAETDDGRFETDVDIDSPLVPGRITYPVGEAGSVTIDATPGAIALVGQEAAPGWVATVDERELAQGDVEIQFRNDETRRSVEFDADANANQLQVDIDTRSGDDYFVRGPVR